MNNFLSFRIIVRILVCIPTVLLCLAYKTWADVPPPLVNQFIGIVDSILQNPIASDCRICHESGVPDRHHLLMGSVMPEPTSAPHDGQTVDITSWTDTLINAFVSSCLRKPAVIVNALMGSAVYSVGAGGGKPDKPCKGKTC